MISSLHAFQQITANCNYTVYTNASLWRCGRAERSIEPIPHVQLEISGDVLSTADRVVQRRDGPRRLREIDESVPGGKTRTRERPLAELRAQPW